MSYLSDLFFIIILITIKHIIFFGHVCQTFSLRVLSFSIFFINFRRSSLENYTSNNTSQHGTTRDRTTQHEYNTSSNTSQHNTTRDNTAQHEATREKQKTTRVIIRYNTSITRPNTSIKEARAAKIGLYFTFFVIELYIFLISFRNS